MNPRQILLVLVLGLPLLAAAAPGTDREDRGEQRVETEERRTQIIIRSDADKKKRKALRAEAKEDSNRQSDPDSERGLERAQERRAPQADAHAQHRTDERGWYEYLFGKRAEAEQKSERDWYGYLFGRQPKEDKREKKDDDSRDDDDSWWWPFD